MLEVYLTLGVFLEHQQTAESKHLELVRSCATVKKGQAFSCQVSYENQYGYFTMTLTPLAYKSNGFPT